MGSPFEPIPPPAPRPSPTVAPDADASRYEPAASDSDTPRSGSSSSPGGRKLPRRFGDYELLAEVARGGMGVVYLAKQLKAGGRKVALKMILGGANASGRAFDDFQREARLVASINHPGIVPVHEVGEVDGQPFYSMTLIEGGSVQQLLQSHGPLEPRAAARLVRQVAAAVQHAHDHTITHRDIKPANILLRSAEPRVRSVDREDPAAGAAHAEARAARAAEAIPLLADFGLARTRAGGTSVTGDKLGTPSYMSPEQAAGKVREVGPASDVYSLGAVLYCVLTGRPPFQSASAVETMRQVLEQEPVPLRELNPAVPRDLETVCLKCLAKEPHSRYASALQLAEELQRVLAGEPIQARPSGSLERGLKWVRRRPALTALMAVSALAFAALAAGGVGLCYHLRLQNTFRQVQLAGDRTEEQRREAVKQRAAADEQRGLARRYLYGAQMNLAQHAWNEANLPLLGTLLEQQIPAQPGREDLRGFEWHYLRRVSHSEGPIFAGPSCRVASITFSPNGRLLATADASGHTRVWDYRTGQETIRLAQKRGQVREIGYEEDASVAFSPDSRHLARLWKDHDKATLVVWEVTSGKKVLDFTEHKPNVCSITRRLAQVAFSNDGRLLACPGWFGSIQVWQAQTGRPAFTLSGEDGEDVVCVAFTPDGRSLLSGSASGRLVVWDLTTRNVTCTIRAHRDCIGGVACSPDGEYLVSAGGDHTIKVWDANTGEETRTLRGHTAGVTGVAFSPDGQLLVSSSDDRSVRLWDVDGGRMLAAFRGHLSRVTNVAFGPDGRYLASCSDDRTARLWDVHANPEAIPLATVDASDGVAFSPDGRQLAGAGRDGRVTIWDLQTYRPVLDLDGPSGRVCGVAFSSAGRLLAGAGADGTVKLWDTHTGRATLTLAGHSGGVFSVAFSPDGRKVASAGADGQVKLWDAWTGKGMSTFQGHEGKVYAAVFRPDGGQLASAGQDRAVRVWDVAAGKGLLTLRGHADEVLAVAFSPDGRRLASASRDQTVKIWDARTGQELFTLKGHTAPVLGVRFSPNGQRLATAGNDDLVKLWDAHTWQEVLTLKGHKDTVRSVAFAPDGRTLVSAGDDRTVLIWETGQASRALVEARHREAAAKALKSHRSRAEQCMKSCHWFGASFHLDHLIGRVPAEVELYSWRGRARGRLGQSEGAAADYSRAIELGANDYWVWHNRGTAHADLRQWDKAILDFTGAIQTGKGQAAAWGERASAYAELGQWQKAVADYAEAATRTEDVWLWHKQGLALLGSGDAAGYRSLCRQLLERFADTRDPSAADAVAFLAVLRPETADDRGLLIRLARVAAAKDPDKADPLETLGAALYRAGKYEEARKCLDSAVQKHGEGGSVWMQLFLGMAHHHLGHDSEANEWWARAVKQIEQMKSPSWTERVCWRSLRKEAEDLLKRPRSTGRASGK